MTTTLEIPPQEVQRRLGVDNPWWKAGSGIDPEEAEGITECVWLPLPEAAARISYDNARDVVNVARELLGGAAQ